MTNTPTDTSAITGEAQDNTTIPAPPDLTDFEVLKLIGQGTFGNVWLATERVTGVHRAIKTFPKTARDTEITGLCEYQRRALTHPHLIPVYLIGQQNSEYYVVMELADDIKGPVAMDPKYYEPCCLDRLLKDRGALPPDEALANLHGMLQAVDYLHRQGLVHRDIKPSNVLFVDGKIKLCDFGLIAPGHQAVDRAGTHGYWRPDGPTDRESDLYATTKVAFQMLTGAQVASFSELPSDLATVTTPAKYRAIKELLDRGCSTNPARRFSSAQAMLSRVEALGVSGANGNSNEEDSRLRRSLAGVSAPITLTALLATVVLAVWLAFSQAPGTAFSPLADMSVVAYPAGEGNPNSLAKSDPKGLLLKNAQTLSMSNPIAPSWPMRYAKIQLVSNPASHMLVFWISPSGFIHMDSSDDDRRRFRSPSQDAFLSLDGERDNYVICAFLNDRPFQNKYELREAVERLANRYRDEHPNRTPLPVGTVRVLRGGDLQLVTPPGLESPDVAAGDFGLLGEIWIQFRHSYPILGIELPLPARSTLSGLPTDRSAPTSSTSQPASPDNAESGD